MITITERAAKRLKEIFAEDGRNILRLAVQGGGCSGFQYAFMLTSEDEIGSGDEVVECREIKIVIDPISKSYVQESEIDFNETVVGGKFEIKNPNAISTCGCGQSFSTE